MSTFFGLIETLFKTGVYIGVGTVGSIGAFAYATKPDEPMLKQTLGRDLTGQSRATIPVIGTTVASMATLSYSIEIKDFVILRTANVTCLGKERMYIGAFQNWIPMDKLQ